MFHFTFIDEASKETEQEILKKQETAQKKAAKQSDQKKGTLRETTISLNRNLDQAKSVRLAINKNGCGT